MTAKQLTSVPVQTVFTIIGFVFLAGVQVQSAKDTREKAQNCESRIERVEANQIELGKELQKTVNRLEKAVTKLEVQIQYIQQQKRLE